MYVLQGNFGTYLGEVGSVCDAVPECQWQECYMSQRKVVQIYKLDKKKRSSWPLFQPKSPVTVRA